MKARVVRIGNSRGLRIPKALLEQCALGDTVELEPRGNQLIVRPVRERRQGWDEAFRRMAETGDDRPLDPERGPHTRWDLTEWRW